MGPQGGSWFLQRRMIEVFRFFKIFSQKSFGQEICKEASEGSGATICGWEGGGIVIFGIDKEKF